MPHKLLLIVMCFFLLQGCGAKYVVNVDSLCAPSAKAKTSYVLLPGNKHVSKNDLQFQEYASYIDRALALGGFTKAVGNQKADIAIFLRYGIGDPQQHNYSYSVPTYGQTGVASSTTYGTVSTYGGVGTYTGTTTYQPTYGITGYQTHSRSYTTYFRFITLEAVDLEEYFATESIKQVWKTTITSTGSSGDLREIFPVMVAAGKDHFGKHTPQAIQVQLRQSDKRIKEISPHLEE